MMHGCIVTYDSTIRPVNSVSEIFSQERVALLKARHTLKLWSS